MPTGDEVCNYHESMDRDRQQLLKEVGRRVPIWVFLAALTFISGVYASVATWQFSTIDNHGAQMSEAVDRLTGKMDDVTANMQEITLSNMQMTHTIDLLNKTISRNKEENEKDHSRFDRNIDFLMEHIK